MGTGRNDNTLYSVKIRAGLDTRHYDLTFTEKGIVLRYLGEYWERSRPVTGLQRRMDLHIYRLRKRRARATGGEETLIPYEEVTGYELHSPRKIRRKRRIAGRTVVEEETLPPRLVLRLRGGKTLEIEFTPRIYELAKQLVKKYLKPLLRENDERAVRRAR